MEWPSRRNMEFLVRDHHCVHLQFPDAYVTGLPFGGNTNRPKLQNCFYKININLKSYNIVYIYIYIIFLDVGNIT
jgi:hypothetical protein